MPYWLSSVEWKKHFGRDDVNHYLNLWAEFDGAEVCGASLGTEEHC